MIILEVHTPVLIKYWYCLVVMMILYSLSTLECIRLHSNQSSTPTQASSSTTALPTIRPSLFLVPVPFLSPTIVSTRSLCIGVRNKFTTPYGDCSIYFGSDLQYYSWDIDSVTNYHAKDVCAQCGECSDPLIANTLPPTSTSSPISPSTVSSPSIVSSSTCLKEYDNCAYYALVDESENNSGYTLVLILL